MKYIILLLVLGLPFIAAGQQSIPNKMKSFVVNTKVYKPTLHALIDIGYTVHKKSKYFHREKSNRDRSKIKNKSIKHRKRKRSTSELRLYVNISVNSQQQTE